ncbi:MAG: HesA/MoeB/ThiF family protein [Pseudomonadota bacterium]
MGLVLALGAGLVGLGHVMRVPWSARFYMVGLLYVAVLGLHVILPLGHPLRVATGGSAEPWLLLGGLIGVGMAYRAVLLVARRRAKEVQGTEPAAAPRAAAFNDDEVERYARHITLPDIGGAGQKRLKSAKVLVVGAGGLGSPTLLYLSAAGVGRLGIIDPDTVSLSNLARQVIHTDARQGVPKVFSAQAAIAARNPFVDVRPYHRALTDEIAKDLVADYDLIVDGTDSYESRSIVNRAAVATGRPLLSGAISAWEGQVTLYHPAGGAPCMACIFPDPPDPEKVRTCAETGVAGPLPGVIGTMMALEALKEITGTGTGLRGRMLIFDGLTAETRMLRIERRAGCPVCGGG